MTNAEFQALPRWSGDLALKLIADGKVTYAELLQAFRKFRRGP